MTSGQSDSRSSMNLDITISQKRLSEITKDDLGKYGCFLNAMPELIPPCDNQDLWVVASDITYIATDGTVVFIIAGSTSDLASTPRLVKAIVDGPGKETIGAVVHDNGYKNQTLPRLNIFTQKDWCPPKSWWDMTFKNIMIMCGTKSVIVVLFYNAVRYFGFKACNDDKR